VQDRGLAAYIAELVGTFFLVLAVCTAVTLFVATSSDAAQGSDFAVVGLVHAFALFMLIITFGAASGGHFNPVITLAAAVLRRIDPLDALVYMLAQLSGGVLGALVVKGLLLDEGRLGHYGAVSVSPLLGSDFAGMIVELLGIFLLVLAVCAVAFNPRARQEWAPLVIGTTLGFAVMIFGPLTGGSFNPARWFGPALISGEFSDAWLYILGPIVGGVAAALLYRLVMELDARPLPAQSPIRGESAESPVETG
jgi:MIP family channel proteins